MVGIWGGKRPGTGRATVVEDQLATGMGDLGRRGRPAVRCRTSWRDSRGIWDGRDPGVVSKTSRWVGGRVPTAGQGRWDGRPPRYMRPVGGREDRPGDFAVCVRVGGRGRPPGGRRPVGTGGTAGGKWNKNGRGELGVRGRPAGPVSETSWWELGRDGPRLGGRQPRETSWWARTAVRRTLPFSCGCGRPGPGTVPPGVRPVGQTGDWDGRPPGQDQLVSRGPSRGLGHWRSETGSAGRVPLQLTTSWQALGRSWVAGTVGRPSPGR